MPDLSKVKFLKLPKRYSQKNYPYQKHMKGALTFELVERTENAALYREKGGKMFEVFEVRVGKPFSIKRGKKTLYFPMREKVPVSNDFGRWAWSYVTEESARKKYDQIK